MKLISGSLLRGTVGWLLAVLLIIAVATEALATRSSSLEGCPPDQTSWCGCEGDNCYWDVTSLNVESCWSHPLANPPWCCLGDRAYARCMPLPGLSDCEECEDTCIVHITSTNAQEGACSVPWVYGEPNPDEWHCLEEGECLDPIPPSR